nr:hypothetical protein [uncultured Pedobacter sp.]
MAIPAFSHKLACPYAGQRQYFFPQKSIQKTPGCALCYKGSAFTSTIRYRKGQGRIKAVLWFVLLYEQQISILHTIYFDLFFYSMSFFN